MFIELTDHLRCPADHDESFLVLLPDKMEGRSVRTGQLGCPVCGRTFELSGWSARYRRSAGAGGRGRRSALDAEGLTALVGLHGPGGYLTLVGPVASLWQEVAAAQPRVALVAVNPPTEVTDADGNQRAPRRTTPDQVRLDAWGGAGTAVYGRPALGQRSGPGGAPGLRVVGRGQGSFTRH